MSFIFVIVCGLFEWKQIFADFASFAYICIEIQLSRGEGWDPSNWFNTGTHDISACSKPRPGFPTFSEFS